MSAIDHMFTKLRGENRKAFMPFITAGDPNIPFTVELTKRLEAAGADMVEVGIPYSDPIADGPVIQESYTRALDRKTTLRAILDGFAGAKDQITMPRVTMVSYPTVLRWGIEAFVDAAQAAGFAGAIVPDLLVEEADRLHKVCLEKDFSTIHLVTPTTPFERAVRIAQACTGFVYYVSVTGTTGERTKLPKELTDSVRRLSESTDTPICIGFGINQPEHVEMLAPVADGLIVGSAIIRRLANAETSEDQAFDEIEQLVRSLCAPLKS